MKEQENKKLHMAIAALGTDKPGLVSNITQMIYECGCDLEDSRMIAMSGEFALIIKVSGVWNAVAKLESSLGSLEHSLNLKVVCKRIGQQQATPRLLPYAIDVVAMDHPGIVYNLANFISEHGINIEEMSTSCYSAAHTGTPMFSVHMKIGIPAQTHIADLREKFIDYCDDLNLDALMEPVKY